MRPCDASARASIETVSLTILDARARRAVNMVNQLLPAVGFA